MAVFGSRWLQRIAALTAMWLVLYVLNLQSQSWALYCLAALALVLEFLAFQTGVVRGIEMYLAMTTEQQQEIQRIIKENE
jgi:hypothetical protein